jgi:glucose-6-phosphate 1-dehydrogenase
VQSVNPFDLVIFGGTGDLAMRKLLPALYYRDCAGQIPQDGRIVAAGRSAMSRDDYLGYVAEKSRRHVRNAEFDEAQWSAFCQRLDYVKIDASNADDFLALAERMGYDEQRVRVFYLSTSPDLFADICAQLHAVNLVTPNARVVLEKPLGRDLASSDAINTAVGAVFGEGQIYRIDHYLGKEPVQNLMALRFGNALFEPLWNNNRIRDVQITVGEQIGVEARGEFYERTGALRDMVQNHMLQLLCIVAMEPPISIDPDIVRDEKLKVLRALRPFTVEDVHTRTVRGQYRAGAVNGEPVIGYLQETGIDPNSQTETYVAIKAEIGTWRWAKVPFYLRTGKRLQERVSEVVVNFRPVPHSIFPSASRASIPNRLVIRLQPDEGMELHLLAKEPGDQMNLKPVHLNLDFSESFKTRQLEAYERLLMDVIRGNLTLFVRRDELEVAWQWVEPIMAAWRESGEKPKNYTAGTWGPAAASALINRDSRSWPEEA